MFCPNCGKEVSALAKNCPGCAHPFKSGSSTNSKVVAFLLCLFFPGFHRFYVGKIWTGILFLLTFGGFLIWWIIDLISIGTDRFEDKAGNKLSK